MTRPARSRRPHLEVTWHGLVYDDGIVDVGWIDLGPVPGYLKGDPGIDWADALEWAAIADDFLGEVA